MAKNDENVGELIARVVKDSGLSHEEVRRRMDERIEKTHGLLRDSGAIYAVAKELGIDLVQEELVLTPIEKIEPQRFVNILCKVKLVEPARDFQRKDGTKGKVSNVHLADNTGEIRMVLWDNMARMAEKLDRNDIILARNLRSREGSYGMDLHVVSLSNVSTNPDLEKLGLSKKAAESIKDIEIKEELTKINEIEPDMASLNMLCRVSAYYPTAEFERENGSIGKRASFIAEDDSGKIRVTLWGDDADIKLVRGDIVKIENAYSRANVFGDEVRTEVHIGSRSNLQVLEEKEAKEIESKFEQLGLKPFKTTYKVNELEPDMRNVNTILRVNAVYPVNTFKRDDGGEGRRASLTGEDDTGEIRVTLWDENADAAEGLKRGEFVKIENAYIRENPGTGALELQVGTYGSVEKTDEKIEGIKEFKDTYKIAELEPGLRFVNLLCRINNYYPPTEFERYDGTVGKRASFIGEDDTGKIRVTLWDDHAEKELERGDIVRIENAYTREGLSGEADVSVGTYGGVIKTTGKSSDLGLEELSEIEEIGEINVGDVEADMRGFSVVARVLRVSEPREWMKEGEGGVKEGKIASIEIGDDSGTIRATLWNEKADIVKGLKRGDVIKITNAYSRYSLGAWGGEEGTEPPSPEIHVGGYGTLTVNPESDKKVLSLEKIESAFMKEKVIGELNDGDRHIKITGEIADIDDRPMTYATCSVCGERVQNLGEGYFCENCGDDVEPSFNLVVSGVVKDGTGSVKVTAFRDAAEKFIGKDTEEVINLLGELQGNESALVEKLKKSLVGAKIALLGRVSYDDFSDDLRFTVDSIM